MSNAPAERAEHRSVDVAIVGGGLVGASLALALAPLIERFGLTVAVIEAAPLGDSDTSGYQPSFDERASAIAFGSRRHFEAMGIWSQLAERAGDIHHIHISQRGHPGVTRLSREDVRLPALGHVLPNAWLGRVLHERLAEQALQWYCPARVEQIAPHPGGHRLVLDSGIVLDAGLTVLADGGRSPLKQQLGIDTDVRHFDQHALIANVEVGRDHRGWAFERFTPEGPMALLPQTAQRMALIWTRPPAVAEELARLDERPFLHALQQHFGDRLGRFRRLGTRHVYPLSTARAREQSRPHLAILGNAAHALHPVAGQGFNLALRGVMALRDALTAHLTEGQAPGNAAMMREFERRRGADRDLIMPASSSLVALFEQQWPGLAHLRSAGLTGLEVNAPLKRLVTRRAMGLFHGHD
ncbi:2-octaprenyl-6-methoxyphenol hydroxylase /2-octaprenyl-3-methyl-6-methoxy-1,4-benzoquinol hydroxylase [Kushneria sinocarnis]|uniref:2-octaprenyl-6-methoxyphenol hydroxylase /2-octaprenyl-3-methyl-6-methoxy-1,4-benzoquinol hydroxylase n=1 Tax=Kushneria sinocarnis TaxID=595502 RepID=A0A420X0H1_9GAMM|nr:2-octaprenyl-6-methoxyphenyl hydroxylase [Kushneria sinocarnis]RKR07346.1 2-octaprenyl-6-methoxyphenol hydroxylase /2-octaprenyl-3-methyl-6-methoxy-1,4-benzoquinol hydroxylase [Kushneria sinocarnis]